MSVHDSLLCNKILQNILPESYGNHLAKDGSIMDNDIGSGVSFKSICFDFFSTNIGSSVIGTRTSNGFDDITH